MPLTRRRFVVLAALPLALVVWAAPAATAEARTKSTPTVGYISGYYRDSSHPTAPRTYFGAAEAADQKCVQVERKTSAGHWTRDGVYNGYVCYTGGVIQWQIRSADYAANTYGIRLAVQWPSLGSFLGLCSGKSDCLSM